jgi:hypothetical protein
MPLSSRVATKQGFGRDGYGKIFKRSWLYLEKGGVHKRIRHKRAHCRSEALEADPTPSQPKSIGNDGWHAPEMGKSDLNYKV